MRLLRIILLAALAWLGLKILSDFFRSGSRVEVKGKPEKKPIDLTGKDVEDVSFEETKKDKSDK